MRALAIVLVLPLFFAPACKTKKSRSLEDARSLIGTGARCVYHDPRGSNLTLCTNGVELVICDDTDGCIRVPLRAAKEP